ncbi:helix-turn-helix domain-containing protein [Catalinimonas sp. 4WD22]|uniref:helix-turn-helix domain-containing protein n=1 Tax=Catalinimonas locisalis TaxID=3133978 RepID=UPI0031016D59
MYSYQVKHPLLRPIVKQAYAFTLSPGSLDSMTAIPTGNVFLIFAWGDGTSITRKPNAFERTEYRNLCVSGQQLEVANHCVQEGEVNIIGIELTPDAIYQFFGVPQYEFTGMVPQLEDTWSTKASLLYRQVIEETDPAKQFALIERFLCQRIISKDWKENAMIAEAIYLLRQSNGNLDIPSLADSLRVSPRTLQRRFLQAVGISPKVYGNIIRFNYAFKQCMLYKKHVLDVVSEAGYYDQPHFVHHFKKVFGTSPGRFFDEQEKVLHFLKDEEDQYPLYALADTLTDLQKLYVF